MPLAVRTQDIRDTITMLRLVEANAADDMTMSEAKRLADLWEKQLDPTSIITGS